MRKPKVLDLFCGVGGASRGYAEAGFEVVGVDINPQPDYPYEFVQADAVQALRIYADQFDLIAASAPCQRDAAITVMGQAFDLALGFHAVQKARHRRLLGHRDLGQLPDADRLAARQRGHHPPLGDRETVLARDHVELRRDQLAGLRQQRRQVVVDEAQRLSGLRRHEGPPGLRQARSLHV